MTAASVQSFFSPFTGRRCRQADEGRRSILPSFLLPLIRHFVTPSPRKLGEGQ